jgi:predicted phage terminase large subunit-like protein
VDDAIGRRLVRAAERWTYVHKRAVTTDDMGNEVALAPSVRSLEEMRNIRAALRETDPDERLWWAQWQNDPRPPGSDLFGTPARYETFPQGGYRIGYGVDFAYTDAPGSDYFAAVAGRVYGRKVYLLDVRRQKLDAVQLEDTCRVLLAEHGRAPLWSYQAGPEVGLSRLLLQRGVPVASMPARYNKLVRAQKTIRRWNDGDVLVPATATWAPGFLHRVSLFRGHERDRDDEVDALVSMVDAILGGGGEPPKVGLGGRGKAYAGMFG